jgi:hypothetical protein
LDETSSHPLTTFQYLVGDEKELKDVPIIDTDSFILGSLGSSPCGIGVVTPFISGQ